MSQRLTSETNDAFLVEGEGGVEDDLTVGPAGAGGVRWLPAAVPPELLLLLLDTIPTAIWRFLTSMKDTDLPRLRGGGRRWCRKVDIS